jgi:hypothetical protein
MTPEEDLIVEKWAEDQLLAIFIDLERKEEDYLKS